MYPMAANWGGPQPRRSTNEAKEGTSLQAAAGFGRLHAPSSTLAPGGEVEPQPGRLHNLPLQGV